MRRKHFLPLKALKFISTSHQLRDVKKQHVGEVLKALEDVPSRPVFVDRFDLWPPLQYSAFMLHKGVGERNACDRPLPDLFLQACGTQTILWCVCLSSRWIKLPIVVGNFTLVPLFQVAQAVHSGYYWSLSTPPQTWVQHQNKFGIFPP